jgi:hypothetical protein
MEGQLPGYDPEWRRKVHEVDAAIRSARLAGRRRQSKDTNQIAWGTAAAIRPPGLIGRTSVPSPP